MGYLFENSCSKLSSIPKIEIPPDIEHHKGSWKIQKKKQKEEHNTQDDGRETILVRSAAKVVGERLSTFVLWALFSIGGVGSMCLKLILHNLKTF